MPRIPLPTPDVMTAEQRKVYDAIVKGPRGTLVGPLRAALHNPELADKWQQVGELLRYRTSLPPEISEIAILVTARRWLSQVEWHMHAIAADKAGIAADVIDEIKQQRRPAKADAKALAVYDYAVELTANGHVNAIDLRRRAEGLGRARHRRADRADRLLHHGGDDPERPPDPAAGRHRAAASGTLSLIRIPI